MGHNQSYQYMHNGSTKWREETEQKEYLYQQTKKVRIPRTNSKKSTLGHTLKVSKA